MWGADSPNRFRYWTSEFERFYSPATGFDIDGAWIDMNEPTSVRRLWLSFAVLICSGFVFWVVLPLPLRRSRRTGDCDLKTGVARARVSEQDTDLSR